MNFITEKQKEIPVIGYCDVLVAGGGIAGISAALSAARNGAKVILIEKECLLGGLATLGLITIYLPLCDGMGEQVSFGIAEELLRLSIKHGVEDRYPKYWLENGTIEQRKIKRFEVQYNPHIFAVLAEQLLINENVQIIYDTSICEVNMQGQKIDAVIIENKSGRSAIKVKAVVDATGDADICKYAGAPTEVFSPQNILANWYYSISNGELKLNMLGYSEIPDDEKDSDTTQPLINRRFSGLDGIELSEMLILGHEKMLENILEKRKSDITHIPVTMPTIPQIRMTRRIVGEYTMCDNELFNKYEDSIGVIGNWRKRGPKYEIPFKSLYSKKVKNLITAGRCISVNDDMWDITRVIPACAVTGEAAGIAASISDDFSQLDVKDLQEKLKTNGVKIKI